MSTIENSKLENVQQLYNNGCSAREIAEEIGVSTDAVYYFFRKNKIPRRNPTENNKLQFQKKEASFKIKTNLTAREQELKLAGTMLYWGEGSQWEGEKIVDFANCKAEMVLIFLAFLREVCGINEKRLRAFLYCYANQDQNKIMRHWSRVTKIPLSQFTKPYIKKDFRVEKSGKMEYGLIHIRYGDKKLLTQIREWIEENYSSLIN